MYELSTNRRAEDVFIEGYVMGYLESWRASAEPGGPFIENLGHIPELYPPWHTDYFRIREGFRVHFALSVWPDTFPSVPKDILARIAPFVHLSGHESLMPLLDDKQLELLSDWHKELVRKGNTGTPKHRHIPELPLRTIHDVIYVLDEVVGNVAETDDFLIDLMFDHLNVFSSDIYQALKRFRVHYMGIITHAEENYPAESLYCESYSTLFDRWEEECGDIEELNAQIENAYKGGGFTCIT